MNFTKFYNNLTMIYIYTNSQFLAVLRYFIINNQKSFIVFLLYILII